ncbi:MAG TPA: riboflavin synthase, partial [Candidatus Saccharimonadales bacterium]|nr:riboflavin synthase [Candidatus Saccharimonadales bacterium]
NGTCLTVIAADADGVHMDVSPETVRVTSLAGLKRGSLVNLERPVRADARMGGHFVQGHVDATAAVRSIRRGGEFTEMAFEAPRALRPFLVEKGSVAVNGVSLTVASLRGGRFTVALIPHTLKETNLSSLKSGSKVNIEVDILAKYVRSFLDR